MHGDKKPLTAESGLTNPDGSLLEEGQGQLVGWHDPDDNRRWVMANKARDLRDKRQSVQDAVGQFVHDGDFIAFGGFGHIRVPMSLVYEIIRQHTRHLILAGKTVFPGPGVANVTRSGLRAADLAETAAGRGAR